MVTGKFMAALLWHARKEEIGMWQRMMWKLQDFMRGRNGFDDLNRALCIGYFVSFFLGAITHIGIFYMLEWLLFIFILYRTFSKKIWDRQQENTAFTGFVHLQKMRWQYRGEYKVFRCKSCNKIVRVPRHKGKIEVTCPKCGERKIIRS